MYKSKLQEFCQKKSWILPVYESMKVGPDHQPHFTATVTVNDVTFESSPVPCRSSKEAQNLAAQVAFNHFSSLNSSPQRTGFAVPRLEQRDFSGTSASTTNPDTKIAITIEVEENRQNSLPLLEIPTSTTEALLHTYKNRLQVYAQKRNLLLPTYSCEIFGPPHARRYKSKVTVDGKSFETPEFFSTLKDAEHTAAKVAFESMSLHLTQEDEILYKSLLQEHSQRKGLPFPTYDTTRSGPSHMPVFVSTVKIGSERYQGQEGKTKKMAEMNAAKAAYLCLTKYQKTQSSNFSIGETSEASSFNLQPNASGKIREDLARSSSISIKEKAQEIQGQKTQSSNPSIGKTSDASSFNLQPNVTGKVKEDVARNSSISIKEQAQEIKGQKTQSSNPSIGKTSHASSFNLQPDVTRKVKEDVARNSSISIKEQAQEIKDNNGKRPRNSTTFEDARAQERGSSTAKSPPQYPKDIASLPIIPPTEPSVKAVLVCPRTPDIIIPEDAIMLPVSDDLWTAIGKTVPE